MTKFRTPENSHLTSYYYSHNNLKKLHNKQKLGQPPNDRWDEIHNQRWDQRKTLSKNTLHHSSSINMKRNIGIKTRFGRNMTAHQCLQTNLIHKVYFRHPDRCTQTISDKQVRHQKTKVLAKSYVSNIPTEANIQNNQNTGSLHTKTDETKRHSKQHNCQRQTTMSRQTRLER